MKKDNKYPRQISIYKIVNDVDDDIYVGSTCNKLYKRLSHHKTSCRNGINFKLYRKMLEIGVDKFKIILIDKKIVNSFDEQRMEERKYYDILKPTLNQNLPYRTKDEEDLWKLNFSRKPNQKQKASVRVKLSRKRNIQDRKYLCSCCDYVGFNQSRLNRHLDTIKHKENIYLVELNNFI